MNRKFQSLLPRKAGTNLNDEVDKHDEVGIWHRSFKLEGLNQFNDEHASEGELLTITGERAAT